MVDPYVSRREDGYPVPVRSPPPPCVGGARPYNCVPRGNTVVNVHVVYDHIAHGLKGDAPGARDVDVRAAAVHGLVAVEDELVLELDHHVRLEDDPQGLVLDDRVAEGARDRVGRVPVRGVRYYIVTASFPAQSGPAEANCAIGQALAVGAPIRVAAPAVVDGVSGEALGNAGGDWGGEELMPS